MSLAVAWHYLANGNKDYLDAFADKVFGDDHLKGEIQEGIDKGWTVLARRFKQGSEFWHQPWHTGPLHPGA